MYDDIHTVNSSFVEMRPNNKFVCSLISNHKQSITCFENLIKRCFEKIIFSEI